MTSSLNIPEPSPSVLEQESRLLRLGRVYSHNNAVTPNVQRDIVKYVIGTHQTLLQYYPDVAKFRKDNWCDWVAGGNNSATYQFFHLNYIAVAFPDVWDAPVGNAGPEDLSATVLDLVKSEIIELLVRMYVLPVSHLSTAVRRSTRRVPSADDAAIPPEAPRKRPNTTQPWNDDDDDEESDDELAPDASDATKNALCALSFGKTAGLNNQCFGEGKWREVGSLEILVQAVHADGDLRTANRKISKLGGILQSQEQFDAIKGIPKSPLGNKIRNFAKIKSRIEELIPNGCFCFEPDQTLLEWLKDGKRYSEGERLRRETHEICPDNSQPMLTDESAHHIRHMINCYNLSVTKFNNPELHVCLPTG